MVTFLLLGFNISIALIVTFTVALIIVNLLGLMYIWDISLNAISLVNLVMVSTASKKYNPWIQQVAILIISDFKCLVVSVHV